MTHVIREDDLAVRLGISGASAADRRRADLLFHRILEIRVGKRLSLLVSNETREAFDREDNEDLLTHLLESEVPDHSQVVSYEIGRLLTDFDREYEKLSSKESS